MAYDFDGSGDYITINKGSAATDLSVISYSFWFAKDSHATTFKEVFWSGGSWSANYHSFVQTNPAPWLAFTANWTSAEAVWYIAIPDTNWHNHVITYSFSSTTNNPLWYQDGVSQTVTEAIAPSGTAGYASDDGTLTIGAYDDGSAEYADGKIAELAIWNRELTAAEAAILGIGFSPLFIPNGLVFYAPMIRGLQDLKSGNVGTATNAVVYPHPRIIYPTGGL